MPEQARAAPYDRKATIYDAVVGLSLYNRVFWGTTPAAFTRFARRALDAAGRGNFAEAGCGSLLFTSSLYAQHNAAMALLVDRSIQMLRRGMKRLAPGHGVPPDTVAALHADVASLPVRTAAFDSLLCLNVLHVPCDVAAITAEFARVLVPGRGRLFVSALVRSGRWSDSYMKALHRAGELAAPVTLDVLCERVAGTWGAVESATLQGNMGFVVVRHSG